MQHALSAELQNAEIAFHRSAFDIRPVQHERMPRWWTARVCRATKGWGRHDAWNGMQSLIADCPFTLFDHWGQSNGASGATVFVTEPYQDADDPQVYWWTRRLANRLRMRFEILDAWHSWHYPGSTIRIEFSLPPAAPTSGNPVYVIDGYPPAIYPEYPLDADDAGNVLLKINGIDRPRWFHPSNVFHAKAVAVAALHRRFNP